MVIGEGKALAMAMARAVVAMVVALAKVRSVRMGVDPPGSNVLALLKKRIAVVLDLVAKAAGNPVAAAAVAALSARPFASLRKLSAHW